MVRVEPVSPLSLRRAMEPLAAEGEEHILLVRENGAALVARLRLLKVMLQDHRIASSPFVLRDNGGCILDINKRLFRIAAIVPLPSGRGIGPALSQARKWVRILDRWPHSGYHPATYPKGSPHHQGERKVLNRGRWGPPRGLRHDSTDRLRCSCAVSEAT
jgi:hypothetical protein